jgi:hypothetical protein
MYEGIFSRIMRKHPLDYYWFWTPEGWTWEGVKEEQVKATIDDILAAHTAAKNVGSPFELATCGWVLGPQFDRAYLGKALPEDISVSCINRQVGHEPVEPAFAEIEGRGKWAIPWLEDDPAMTSVQLWVGRMRRDARDALEYGCNGLMGIHWRTRILGPNVSSLANAAWDQSGWAERKIESSGPVGGRVAASEVTDVTGTEDDTLFRTVRYDATGYKFVVPNGSYRVTLHFCETFYKEPGKRVFGVNLEEKPAIESLDLFKEVGRNTALVRAFENIEVRDGVLDVDFVKQTEFPSIAAIAVEGSAFSQKVNCGGEEYGDYIADPVPLPVHPSADDFYRDWTLHLFGPEVSEEAARILAKMDGQLPRPSDWVGGPGGYNPDARPWEEVSGEYAFVDEFANLRPQVKGPGNLERFDYWLNNFQFLRATGKMKCAWGTFDRALKSASAETDLGKRVKLAKENAFPLREELIGSVEQAYGRLLATVNTYGAMGTVCNLEQHTFPKMLVESGKELERLLGEPLPPSAQLGTGYTGEVRLFVPTVRSSLESGEPLEVKAVFLDRAPAKEACLYWREMGGGEFSREPMGVPARCTYTVALPGDLIPHTGIEYYIEAVNSGGETIRWPATAPEINHTVVVLP